MDLTGLLLLLLFFFCDGEEEAVEVTAIPPSPFASTLTPSDDDDDDDAADDVRFCMQGKRKLRCAYSGESFSTHIHISMIHPPSLKRRLIMTPP